MKTRLKYALVLGFFVTLCVSVLRARLIRNKSGLSLVVDKIESKPSSSAGYDTELTMYLSAEGKWPKEVTDATTSSSKSIRWGMSDECDLFYMKNGQLRQFQWPPAKNSVLYPAAIYDQDYGGFIRKYQLNLSAIPANIKPLQCRIITRFYSDTAKSYQGKGLPMKADTAISGSIQLR